MAKTEVGMFKTWAVAISLKFQLVNEKAILHEWRISLPETQVGDDGGAVEVDSTLSTRHQSPAKCEKPKSLVANSVYYLPTDEVPL